MIAREERMILAEVTIREAPPTRRQAKDRVGPELGIGDIHEDEAATGREEALDIAQRGAEIGHGMEHVGADDEVKALELELLLRRGFLKVEDLELHFRTAGELLARGGKENGRDVAEGVGVQAALKKRQEMRGEAAGPGADLKDAEAASFRQAARRLGDGGGNRGEPMARVKALAVKLVKQLRARTAKQDLHGILFAAQDRAELRACWSSKGDLRQDVRDAY